MVVVVVWCSAVAVVYLSVYLYICLSICLSVYLAIYLSIYRSIYLSICTFENEAILRDFLNFELDKVKKEAILRDFLRVWRRSNSARPSQFLKLAAKRSNPARFPKRFAFFPLHLSKVLRLPLKNWCQVMRSAAPVTQSHLIKPFDTPKCNPSQEITALTS